ncbi:TolC family outer membrane protein [Allorhizobium taibaishanense]|uniref:Outer membrane protein n=1 Tax=Allorhizobium taibaishanense TaxID=887144 RepID=A0A1Q9A3E4_9HYPH|nr:TolC family outer membrane protein [Allorhizobium taibaishanense]MBB4006039.1 outer membrane protein [Allorhizobium taibaishanense]OLP49056.1 transporter [Allorhizobium taibaishanense]
MSSLRKVALAAAVLPLLFQPCVLRAETIFGAMEKAYKNNPDLNSVRAALRATDESVTIAKAGYRPQLGISMSATQSSLANFNGGAIGARPADKFSEDYYKTDVQITLTQQIFDGFQTLNNVRYSEASVRSSRESMKADEIQILLGAAQAYADVARDQQLVAIRRQNLNFLKEQLKSANARLDVGEGTKTDVAQAEAQLAAAESLLASAISQLRQSEASYVAVVGEMPKDVRQPVRASKAMPANLDAAVAVGIREHPNVLAALHAVSAAQYQVKYAEGSLLPGVSIQGAFDRHNTDNPSESSDRDYSGASITAQVKIPLYQGGSEYGQIRKAKETVGSQELKVDYARLSVRKQVMTAYAQMQAATAAIASGRKQVAAAKLALQGVIEERNVGQKITLDVLNSQQTVLDAEESLVTAQRNEVVASYSLLASTGALTVQSQGLKVAEYKPEEHYEAVKDQWFGMRAANGK